MLIGQLTKTGMMATKYVRTFFAHTTHGFVASVSS